MLIPDLFPLRCTSCSGLLSFGRHIVLAELPALHCPPGFMSDIKQLHIGRCGQRIPWQTLFCRVEFLAILGFLYCSRCLFLVAVEYLFFAQILEGTKWEAKYAQKGEWSSFTDSLVAWGPECSAPPLFQVCVFCSGEDYLQDA